MEIRTFEAFTMKDAVKQVKDQFGLDAVILETKTKPSTAGKGMVYEVTAAPAGESFVDGASKRSNTVRSSTSVDRESLIEWQRKLNSFETKLDGIYEKSLRREHLISIESSVEELRVILMDYLRKDESSVFKNAEPAVAEICLLYTSPSPRDAHESRMPSSA